MKNPLAHTPWWTTPLGLLVTMMAADQLARTYSATMLIVGAIGVLAIGTAIVVLIAVIKR